MSHIIPFLRWPGGKRWIAPQICEAFNSFGYSRYIEPFLGGGAVFFALRPPVAIVSDLNSDLISTYKAVKRYSHALKLELSQLECSQSRYYSMRDAAPKGVYDTALRFLYLNRLAFSGMYRVNRFGKFNVPFGGDRDLSILTKTDVLKDAASALKAARIVNADFESVLDEAGDGDAVYCDPTYSVTHNGNGFIRYNEKNFKWSDQIRLSEACFRARKRGAIIIVSNAAHDDIKKLYRGVRPVIMERNTTLSRLNERRQKTNEYLFIIRP